MLRAEEALDRRPWLSIPLQTVKEFRQDNSPMHAAALAFFTLFSVVPMVVLALLAASRLFGGGDSSGQLFQGADTVLGAQRAEVVRSIIMNAQPPGGGLVTTLVGVLVLLFAASRLFIYLEVSMNRIWDVVPRKDRPIMHELKTRLASFALVLGVVVLLVVGLLMSSILSGVTDFAADVLPYEAVTIQILRAAVTIALFTGLFMMLFKFLPDVRIRWGDVVVGAFVTAVLVAVGQYAIGIVLSGSTLANAYGALSTIVIALLWFYYTSLIFLFGAEFTQVFARWRGHPIEPLPKLATRRGRKVDQEQRRRAQI